jgi:type I restriction enzyme S subunit
MIKKSTIEKITLPKDWKMLPFGDVCEISGGSQPPKPTFIYEAKEGYIRLVQVRDYRTNNFITYIPKEKAKKFCNKTDIMIGRYGPPIFGIFRGLEGAYNVALMKAIPNKELLNQEYLYWFLKTDSLVKFVEKSSKRAAGQDGVRKEVLYTYPTPLPPLPQQKQIVATLDKAFAAIDTAKANTEQNLQNAKELFESYLKNVFDNKGDDWEEGEFGNIITTLTDYHANGSYKILKKNVELKDNDDYAWMIRSTDFEKSFKNQFKYIDEHAYNFMSKSKVFGNEIIMSKIGNAGKTYLMPKIDRPISLAMNLFLIRLDESRALPQFVFQFLKSEKGESQIKKRVKGATTKTITKDNVRNIIISYPSLETQKDIVQKLDILSLETKKLEAIYTQKIADLEEMKKSVLQKAFSGQLNTVN